MAQLTAETPTQIIIAGQRPGYNIILNKILTKM